MKYMLILKANEESETGRTPTDEELSEMGRFNDELISAGVMLAGEGLHPSSEGARVDYDGEQRSVTDGPFAETKELIAGFWIIQAQTKDEALEWARRAPLREGSLEVRRIFDVSEFDQDNEYVQTEKQWREENEGSRTA